jgi:hypothetical protein
MPPDTPEARIAAWLQQHRAAHDLSWERWATLAGTSSTNITRFLKHGTPVPKLRTIQALAAAIGVACPEFNARPVIVPLERVPVLLPSSVLRVGWKAAMEQATEWQAVSHAGADTAAFRVTEPAFLHAVLAGDTVIVEPRDPQPGDLVAVATGTDGCAIYACAPGLLMPGVPGQTTPVPIGSLMVLGVVVEVQRSLKR